MICTFIINEEISFYKNLFISFYCKTPIRTFDNILVFFKENNFEHAFFESVNRREKDKSKFSYKRANRIYWIKWVLENPTAELYKGYNHLTKSYDDSRRISVCIDNYIVVIELNKKQDKATFITAYIADGVNGKGKKAIDLIKSGEKW
ncbi:MAG: hypothetical protein Q8O89_04430 [Nanoarchaeota archaeon]|nr:hypothetical protein [Nanoarchaeota archaeon]